MIAPRPHFATALILSLLALPGCDKAAEMMEKGAEAVQNGAEAVGDASLGMSEDDKLGEKLNAYIDCINRPSSSIHKSAGRYADWVDLDKGITGKERRVYGLYDHELDTSCVEGIVASNNADPDDPELEKVAAAWSEAYKSAQSQIHSAYEYYDHEDYKDDAFAKGKEMHAGLVKAFTDFDKVDVEFRRLVQERNDALQVRRLETLEKEEGRKLRFQNANLMSKAKALMATVESPNLEDIDMDKLQAALDAYTKAHEEAEAYVKANEAEADSVTLFDSFVDDGEDFLKASKELMRRKRDNKSFSRSEKQRMGSGSGWTVEGSPDKMSRAYNDLVSASNRLSWNFYKPNG